MCQGTYLSFVGLAYQPWVPSIDLSLQNLANYNYNSNNSIKNAYEVLVRTLKHCANRSCPVKRFKRFLKPYWTNELTTLHKSMMASRKRKLDAGRLRDRNNDVGSLCKTAKRHFRRVHRQASENFMKKQLDEIDRLAEVDQRLFLHHVNSRRKRPCNAAGSNINFGGGGSKLL